MTVQANWFVADIAAQPDPVFGEARIEQVGAQIDLRAPQRLQEQLASLIRAEGELYQRGVTCAIRDRPDTSCCACPAAGLHGVLCEIGQQQERVVTQMAVNGHGSSA